jgi:hypothetical protein
MFHEVIFAFPIDTTILYKSPQFDHIHNLVINFQVVSEKRSVCMYFPQDLLFNCDKYDKLRKTLFHKIKSLLCPNVNLNSFKNELNTYLVELFLQGSDDLSMNDNMHSYISVCI